MRCAMQGDAAEAHAIGVNWEGELFVRRLPAGRERVVCR